MLIVPEKLHGICQCTHFIPFHRIFGGYDELTTGIFFYTFSVRYLSTPEPPPLPSVPSLADNGCKTRLLRHLDQCIAEIETEICPRTDPATTPANTSTKCTIPDKAGYV